MANSIQVLWLRPICFFIYLFEIHTLNGQGFYSTYPPQLSCSSEPLPGSATMCSVVPSPTPKCFFPLAVALSTSLGHAVVSWLKCLLRINNSYMNTWDNLYTSIIALQCFETTNMYFFKSNWYIRKLKMCQLTKWTLHYNTQCYMHVLV